VPFTDTWGVTEMFTFLYDALLMRNLIKPEMNFINSRDKYGRGEKIQTTVHIDY
jgi:hypothetical protein